MTIAEVILIAVGLAMDALAVSLCKGLADGKIKIKNMLICGAWFGIFQAVMPLIGFSLASIFSDNIRFITPWISFALLLLLGVKMIVEAIKERKSLSEDKSDYGFTTMFLLAVATSIDALAVGVTFAFNGATFDITVANNIWLYITIIGAATFAIAAAGNAVGSVLGAVIGLKFKFFAGLLGGVILCAIGVRFLVTGIIDVTTVSAVIL